MKRCKINKESVEVILGGLLLVSTIAVLFAVVIATFYAIGWIVIYAVVQGPDRVADLQRALVYKDYIEIGGDVAAIVGALTAAGWLINVKKLVTTPKKYFSDIKNFFVVCEIKEEE